MDLGSSRTRIFVHDHGVVCDEPTVLAIETKRDGGRRVIAVGRDALPMVGRTPPEIQTVHPVHHAHIEPFDAAEAYVRHLVEQIRRRGAWKRPRVSVGVPWDVSDVTSRAISEVLASVGVRDVRFVPRPLAAALGAELPIDDAAGMLVVDLGGAATEIGLLAHSGIVDALTVPGGGRALDDTLIDWLAQVHQLAIGRPTAERLKVEVGLSGRTDGEQVATVRGRCLAQGLPRVTNLPTSEISHALMPAIERIGDGIRSLLGRAPPELSTDVVDRGMVLTGGGSRLTGLADALRAATRFPCIVAEDAERAVVLGLGLMLRGPARPVPR